MMVLEQTVPRDRVIPVVRKETVTMPERYVRMRLGDRITLAISVEQNGLSRGENNTCETLTKPG